VPDFADLAVADLEETPTDEPHVIDLSDIEPDDPADRWKKGG
jgi:hypothetical protein